MENVVYGYITLDDARRSSAKSRVLNQLKFSSRGNALRRGAHRSVAADVQKQIESRGHRGAARRHAAAGKTSARGHHGDCCCFRCRSFGLFVLVLSGVIVVNLLTAMMASQVRQIGVMKAIGGTRWQIARIYFGQALLLGIAAIAIAIPLGIAGSRALCRDMAVFLNFDINSFAVPIWVYLLVALVGLIVPLLAAAFR